MVRAYTSDLKKQIKRRPKSSNEVMRKDALNFVVTRTVSPKIGFSNKGELTN